MKLYKNIGSILVTVDETHYFHMNMNGLAFHVIIM